MKGVACSIMQSRLARQCTWVALTTHVFEAWKKKKKNGVATQDTICLNFAVRESALVTLVVSASAARWMVVS